MLTVNPFCSTKSLEEALAMRISDALYLAIKQRDKALLMVSGGNTPKQLFTLLSQSKIDWSKVTITLADERWVDTENDASNEKSIRHYLLQNNATLANFVSLKSEQSKPEDALPTLEKRLSDFEHKIDVVILGMGDDGHTASLFPKAPQLKKALDMSHPHLLSVMTPQTAPHERITFSLPALLNSHLICVHIVGGNKKKVFEQALAGNDIEEMPIRAILHQNQTPVEVYWAEN